MVADPAAVRLRVDVSEGLWVPRYEPWRDRRRSAGRDACVQETRWQDFSFLERRSGRRYGVAVLESDGLHAGGSAGPADAAAKLQAGVFREECFEEVACQELLNSQTDAFKIDALELRRPGLAGLHRECARQ